MKYFLLLFLFVFSNNNTYSFQITRYNFIKNNIASLITPFFTTNNDFIHNHNALIISCNKIGKQIATDFQNLKLKTTITTTKPKRFEELSAIAANVVFIPQIEYNDDLIMKEVIENNDVIILADTISIFSIHTFVRTCKRIANAINYYDYNYNSAFKKPKTIILISSVNVYGVHIDGAIVNELSSVAIPNEKNDDPHWQLNHVAISSMMRIGENILLALANNGDRNKIRTVVLRTSTILDRDTINNIKNRDFNNQNYSKKIGNGYMSVSLTEEISNCVKWIIENKEVNGVFNLVSNSYKRKYFYDRLFDIIGKKKIKWIDDNYLNKDYYYSMDENPILPYSQRYNMKVDYSKLLKNGYKFKYRDIWKFIDV